MPQPMVPAAAKPSNKGKLSESLKFCNDILRELFSKKHSGYAWPFYKPVDADQLGMLELNILLHTYVQIGKILCKMSDAGLHDYHDIIKEPMDLGTVKAKMDNREYVTPEAFASDVRKIFQNCITYNPEGHDVVGMAKKLRLVFEERFGFCPKDPINPNLLPKTPLPPKISPGLGGGGGPAIGGTPKVHAATTNNSSRTPMPNLAAKGKTYGIFEQERGASETDAYNLPKFRKLVEIYVLT